MIVQHQYVMANAPINNDSSRALAPAPGRVD